MDDNGRASRSTGEEREPDTVGASAFGGVALIALSAALVTVRGHVAPAVVALILSCGVAIAGQLGGRHAGLAAAVAAAVGFNFFHTEPYLSLRIHGSDDVWTTATLLAVGLVTGLGSDLASGWHRRARRADDELAALERFIEVAVDGRDVEASATTEIAQLLGLAECTYVRGPVPDGVAVASRRGALPDRGQLAFGSEGFALPPEGLALLVVGGGRPLGYVMCKPGDTAGTALDRRRAAAAIAGALGDALAARDSTR